MTMTNKVFFENVIKANISKEMTEKAKALLETANKKSASKAKAQTANAMENLKTARTLMAFMHSGTVYAVSEVKALAKSELHPSKISACFKVAVECGELTVTEGYKVGGKGRAVKGYSLAVQSENETEGSDEPEVSADEPEFSEDELIED